MYAKIYLRLETGWKPILHCTAASVAVGGRTRSMERLLPSVRRAENKCRIGFQSLPACLLFTARTFELLRARPRESDRTLRDGTFRWRCPRHFVPGYDRTVPPGQKPFAHCKVSYYVSACGFYPGFWVYRLRP
jgi:hypothetical protein